MERIISQPDRRTVLGAALFGGAALILAAAGCGSPQARQRRVEAYLPTTLSESEYDTIGLTLGTNIRRIGRIPLAFADIDPHVPGVQPPALSPGLKQIVQAGSPRVELSLAVGGGSVAPALWEVAASNPARFGVSVNHVRQDTEEIMQRPVHVTLDCESEIAPGQFRGIVRSIRDNLPSDRDLAVAVPVDSGIGAAFKGLKTAVQQIQVMAYDQYGYWSKVAGPVTSWSWASSGVARWTVIADDSQQVDVVYPAYGYMFTGAREMGEAFKGAPSMPYTQLPHDTIKDDTSLLTSEAVIDGNIVSCASPRIIGLIAARLAQVYPNLSGVSSFWSMNGLTPEHLDAVGAYPVYS